MEGFYSPGSIFTLSPVHATLFYPLQDPLGQKPPDLAFLQSYCFSLRFWAHALKVFLVHKWKQTSILWGRPRAAEIHQPGWAPARDHPPCARSSRCCSSLTAVCLQQRGSGLHLSMTSGLPSPGMSPFQRHGRIYLLLGPELRVLRESQHSKATWSADSASGASPPSFALEENHAQNSEMEPLAVLYFPNSSDHEEQLILAFILQTAWGTQLLRDYDFRGHIARSWLGEEREWKEWWKVRWEGKWARPLGHALFLW